MKRLLIASLFTLLAQLAWAADDSFTQSLTSDDYKSAGLDRLLPAERARLDALVAAFKQQVSTQALQEARQKEQAAVMAQHAAEAAAKTAQKEAELAKAEALARKAEAAENKSSEKGFLAKAKVLLVPGTKIEYAEISSTIEGPFQGWSGRTIFHLTNGQRWQIINGDERYFVPPQQNVEVQIRPAALGGFWMFFPSLDKQVRVKLLGPK